MAGFVEGVDRGQLSLLPGSLDDWANAFGALSFVATIEVVAALVSLGLAVAGLKRGAATPGGLRMFERCILTWIVVIQPFAFYEAQFFASQPAPARSRAVRPRGEDRRRG